MKHRVAGFVVLIALAVTTAVLSGCGGDAGYIMVPVETDDIAGHWVVSQQSATLTGARSAATLGGDVSFVFTQSGLKTWSGSLPDRTGTPLDPASGPWLKAGNNYALSNVTGQNGSFAWRGSELYSTTRVGGEIVYLWWSKR